jgi:3-methyladenine DNA glycosylase AlkD
MTAKEIIAYMESLQNEEQRRVLMGFFKTGPGEYGEGDEFLGLKVPQTREVVKAAWKDFPLDEVPELLMSKWHEVRLCGLLILVAKFERLTKRAAARTPLECTERTGTERTPLECTETIKTPLKCTETIKTPLECTETIKTPLECAEEAIRGRDEILTMYLQYAERANNWDLVDLSVHKILGHWLLLPTNLGDRDYKIKVLDELAQSDNLWKQRMSIVCSWKTSQMGDPSWCLRYAETHLHHPHDLMHKAVGWMLREMGKRVSMDLLREFLRQHAHEMPRTMLRYAIEKMSEQERQYWMKR